MRQALGQVATLLAAPASANGVPSGNLAGVSLSVFGSGLRAKRYAITPRLDSTGGTKAELDLDTPSAALDTVVRARAGGSEGNGITVRLLADSDDGVEIDEDVGALTVIIHIEDAASTVADVEAAIGTDSTLIEVKTTGTGATVLGEADEFAATNLAGGADASVSGIFTLWGKLNSTEPWTVIQRLNAGSAVAGTEPHAQTFVVDDLGFYGRLYLQAASLTGTASATIAEIIEGGL